MLVAGLVGVGWHKADYEDIKGVKIDQWGMGANKQIIRFRGTTFLLRGGGVISDVGEATQNPQ